MLYPYLALHTAFSMLYVVQREVEAYPEIYKKTNFKMILLTKSLPSSLRRYLMKSMTSISVGTRFWISSGLSRKLRNFSQVFLYRDLDVSFIDSIASPSEMMIGSRETFFSSFSTREVFFASILFG